MLPEDFARRIAARSMRGIAIEVADLIRTGEIPIGTHLPPVRDLAELFGVSPSTISGAWKQLRAVRMVRGVGRAGMWVCGDQTLPRPARYEDFASYGEHIRTDLRFAVPDLALLPDPVQALRSAHEASHLHNTIMRDPILPELKAAVAIDWPYRGGEMTAVSGGYEGLQTVLEVVVVEGAIVAVEDPTTLRIFDILEKLGARVIGVECDEQGPTPESLANALTLHPSLFVYQPGSHSLTGQRVGPTRMKQIKKVLSVSNALILELDGLAGLASVPPLSLGKSYPERTIHIRTFSKSLGADMRLAVLSCSARLLDRIQAYRNFGAGWTSRLLQKTVATLLQDSASIKQVATARDIYGRRRLALATGLAKRGLFVSGQDALCIWLPVANEEYALATLAARGIAVQPGSRFQIVKRPHIRIATSCELADIEMIADALHDAARGAGEGRTKRLEVSYSAELFPGIRANPWQHLE